MFAYKWGPFSPKKHLDCEMGFFSCRHASFVSRTSNEGRQVLLLLRYKEQKYNISIFLTGQFCVKTHASCIWNNVLKNLKPGRRALAQMPLFVLKYFFFTKSQFKKKGLNFFSSTITTTTQ